MEKVEFFEGQRLVDEFDVFKRRGGKIHLRCRVSERWAETFADDSTCGEPVTFKLRRTIGVSSIERESLEAAVTGILGTKGVAEISSQIKGVLGRELKLEEVTEAEKTFTFRSPKCGRKVLQIFQLQRLYEFDYEDKRVFRRKRFKRTLLEWVSRSWGQPTIIPFIPECNCKVRREAGFRGMVKIAFEKFGLLTDFQETQDGLTLPSMGISMPSLRLEDILHERLRFERSVLPDYLLFMADEGRDELTGAVLPPEWQRQTINYRLRSSSRSSALPSALVLGCIGFLVGRILKEAMSKEYALHQGVAQERELTAAPSRSHAVELSRREAVQAYGAPEPSVQVGILREREWEST